MAPSDEDDAGRRQVLMGLGALVVITLLVGGVVSAMALGAAKLTGIGESTSSGPVEEPSMYIPTGEPTTTPEAYPDPSGFEKPTPTESESEPEEEETTRAPRSRGISLQAFPTEVSPGERINLTGVYPTGEGATLQVQRFEGGWSDFPVTASVSGGIFNTYIVTSRSGATRLRVVDEGSGQSSNPVTVKIR